MHLLFRKSFKKQYLKLPNTIQRKFNERLALYLENENSPVLNVHALKGKNAPFVSMNITADYRALFVRERDRILFYRIGTHSELY